jgi:hypothetical protein
MNRFHYLVVAGASAKIAFQSLFYLMFCGIGAFIKQRRDRKNHPWRAKSALHSPLFQESLLYRS